MRTDNKIPLSEVHHLLNLRCKEEVPKSHFEDLLWCWRRYVHKTRAGKDGWLSRRNTTSFLHYAHHLP